MPVNHPSPLLSAQCAGSGSLRSITRGRNPGLARSNPKENIHPINSKAFLRVVRAATQTGTSASKSKRRSAATGDYLSPTAGVRPCPEGFAKSGLANSPCFSKSTRTARTPLRAVSNVSTGQITPTRMNALARVKTPLASEKVVYPCTPTSKRTTPPRKPNITTTSSPDVFTTRMPTSPEARLSQDTPHQTTKTSLPSSPLPSFVICSPIKNTRRTSLPAPRRSSPPPPASRRLSLPTRSVAPADPLPSFITIEAVILPLARPGRPTSTTTASLKSNKSRSGSGSGSVREVMIAASVNRLADLVSVLDNCERRIDEALGTTTVTGTGFESGLDGGLVATGGECTTTFDGSTMDSDLDSDGIRTPVGSVDHVGQLVNSEEEKGPTLIFEYYWDADGDLVRKDPSTDSDDVALEECLEKERSERECLERARELVRMRMGRRVAGRRDVC